MNCSVARTLEVIGEWWTMLVVREAFNGVRRFDDFQGRLGIARNVLAARLQGLVEHGILERRLYQERPERYEYRLTPKGFDLYPVLLSLINWGDRWETPERGIPVRIIHECGEEAHAALTCSACGKAISARETRAVPGPGALPGQLPERKVTATG